MSLFSTSASPVLTRPPLGPLPPRRRYYNAFGESEADEYESPSGGRVGESSLPVVKSFQGVEGGWTVTDAGEWNLSFVREERNSTTDASLRFRLGSVRSWD